MISENSVEGYVVLLHRQEGIRGHAIMVDPWDTVSQMQYGYTPSQLYPVLVESEDVFRVYPMEYWPELIEEKSDQFTPGMGMVMLDPACIESWGLRPLQWVSAIKQGKKWSVIKVEGLSSARFSRCLPRFSQVGMNRDYASIPIPWDRIDEISPDAPGLDPAQYQEIRSGMVPLTRQLSVLAPPVWGMLALASGPPTSGKTFDLAAMLYVMRWVFLSEILNLHVVSIGIGERPQELTEFARLSDVPRINSFGTAFFDMPATNQIYSAQAGLERAERIMETGGHVVVIIDSMSRLANAWALVDEDGRTTTGGQSKTGLSLCRAALGLAGVYPDHQVHSQLPRRDGKLYDSPPTITVLASNLNETGDRGDDVLHRLLHGTASTHWAHTLGGFIEGYPKFRFGEVLTRRLAWLKLSPGFLEFADAVSKDANQTALAGGRFDANACATFWRKTFSGPSGTIANVFRVYNERRRRNELYLEFEYPPEATRILVVDWDLTVEQVRVLRGASIDSAEDFGDLYRAGITKEDILSFLENQAPDLLDVLRRWRREWSADGYTTILNDHNSNPGGDPDRIRENNLGGMTVKNLREAGVSATELRSLLLEGHSFEEITEAARRSKTLKEVKVCLEKTKKEVKG